jgi:hypothetical protein
VLVGDVGDDVAGDVDVHSGEVLLRCALAQTRLIELGAEGDAAVLDVGLSSERGSELPQAARLTAPAVTMTVAATRRRNLLFFFMDVTTS